MKDNKWVIKVTSKGQVTLPKPARDLMMVREGDHLDAVLKDGSLVLTRKIERFDTELMRDSASRLLSGLGYSGEYGERKIPDRLELRDSIGPSQPDLTRLIREGRERE